MIMSWPLEPIKSDHSLKRSEPFYVCDIEAHKWIDFKVIGLYGPDNDYKYFLNLGDFFRYLVSDEIPKKKIFAHFGGIYDFMFLLNWLVLENKEGQFEVGDIIPRGSGILFFDVVYTDVVKGEDGIDRKVKTVLKFCDSSAMLPFGLESLTKSFEVKHIKGKFDFEKWDGKVTKELLRYLESDCKGLYEVIKKYYNWPLIKRAGPSPTIASQAMRVFRTFMKKEIHPLRRERDEFTRMAYFGGRTEVFKPYFEEKGKTLKTYDVNSLYPSVMLKYDYPIKATDRTYSFSDKGLGIFHVDVEVPEMYIPPLGSVIDVPSEYEYYLKGNVKKVKKLLTPKFVFPTGTFTGHWTNKELVYAMSKGVKIKKVHYGIMFENGGKIFEDYISRLYEMRLEAIKKGDGVTNIICKLLMNSLYGKFGMNNDRENLSFDPSDFDSASIHTVFENGSNKVPLFKSPVFLNGFTNPAVSCFVTSYSRIDMGGHFDKCGEDIYYTDTDSLFTGKNLKGGDELGQLKLEYESKRAAFLLPKTYAVEQISGGTNELVKKVAMKGFDRKITQNFTIEDFQNALEGEVGALKATNPAKMARFKTALRKKGFLSMMEAQDRQVRSFYDKRRVYKTSRGDYDTEPLHIRNGEVVNVSQRA
jgi:hypothetical protein